MTRIPAISVNNVTAQNRHRARSSTSRLLHRSGVAALTALVVTAAGCSSSAHAPGSGAKTPVGHAGGTFTILANTSFGVADPAQRKALMDV